MVTDSSDAFEAAQLRRENGLEVISSNHPGNLFYGKKSIESFRAHTGSWLLVSLTDLSPLHIMTNVHCSLR